jgi:hypothetical protein
LNKDRKYLIIGPGHAKEIVKPYVKSDRVIRPKRRTVKRSMAKRPVRRKNDTVQPTGTGVQVNRSSTYEKVIEKISVYITCNVKATMSDLRVLRWEEERKGKKSKKVKYDISAATKIAIRFTFDCYCFFWFF